jgi:hypothetical protein
MVAMGRDRPSDLFKLVAAMTETMEVPKMIVVTEDVAVVVPDSEAEGLEFLSLLLRMA